MWFIVKDSRKLRNEQGDYRSERYDLDKAARAVVNWGKENK